MYKAKTKDNLQRKYSLWFEHYIYYSIKHILKLKDDEIKLGIKLFKKEKGSNYTDDLADNEIDIVFVINNIIHIIEVKASVGKQKPNTTALTNYLYKLAAINKRFGINAKAALMVFSDLKSLSGTSAVNMKKRCEILNLPYPFDCNDITETNKFQYRLLTLVN
jgi:hypothetical protein